ncbi:DNA alkylation repair protein [Butyrivibrio sp. MC2021]|uniref:DNA alkylation repair protein n=1 Tax=Butyrivibrio sp. MC2021 TaxID=1408306 RepID=UPI00047AB922|nr:DNA alkylation repair protein [Butyrivibrio sp. MC2021]
MITEEIRDRLFELQDIKYRDFQSGLFPTLEKDVMIGVRTPELRTLAKEYGGREDIGEFLTDLPHKYFDENQLHAFIISGEKNVDTAMAELNAFLPYVDNWATCDQMSPKVFKKHRDKLLVEIDKWLKSELTYTIRFGIGMLMEHFLDEDYDVKYPETVAQIRSEEYYVNMMIAWYFATALAKQYDTILPFFEGKKLDTWTHNKAIQKAVESYRITPEQKGYLKTLKIK